VNSPPEAATLALLQGRFAAALRDSGPQSEAAIRQLADCIVDDGLEPARRVQVYRNNARAMFVGALERTYPVVRRQAGDEQFSAMARDYRAEHPSRSGDLHWVGMEFPPWLARRVAGSELAWLAELARLEWACEEAMVAPRLPPLAAAELARVSPETLAELGLVLQPCLRTVSSPFPVWSAWRAGQVDGAEDPVDLALGAQHVVVTCDDTGLVLRSLPEDQFRFVAALRGGSALGNALELAALDVEALPGVLAWLFGEGLVTAMRIPANENALESPFDGDRQ
jgi:hypothetical protein